MSETNREKCFVIMPISDQGNYPMGHFTRVYEQIIKPSVEWAGYEAYRVDENNICDSIMNKIFNAIQECSMAICDLSNRNPNVLYELGLRQAYDKPVVLIQDDKTEKIFDVSGISTIFYKSTRLYEDVIEARKSIKNAILATKEGKTNSLVKIMKMSIADFSQVKVSQDDMTNIILEGIYNEIRELKSKENVLLKDNIKFNSNNLEESISIGIIYNKEIEQKSFQTIKKVVSVCKDEIAELITVKYHLSSNSTIILKCLIKNNAPIEKIVKLVCKIAKQYNIEFDEEYVIYDN